jgi:F0F1-type ATP synthase membrane subunit b/b'
MDKTLHDLAGIILEGLPTFVLVLILAAFVRSLYLKPLEKVLAERYRLTEGARRTAEESLKSADSRIAEYQAALAKAHSEIYKDQEAFLKQFRDEQAALTREAREHSDNRVAEIKLDIAKEADAARSNLEAQADTLATQIADAILMRRNAA